MNWKSSLMGAVVVIAAGLGVGVAIGAKKAGRAPTGTTTVARTIRVTVTTTTPATTSTPTATATTGTSTAPPASSKGTTNSQQYYADYLSIQSTGNGGNNASLDSSPSTIELKGQTYSHAIAFDLSPDNSQTNSESYQLPIPGFKHVSASLAGLQTSTPAGDSYKLTIYKDNDNPGATVLYNASFAGPSGTHAVSFDTQGATDLLFVWGSTTADANSTNSSSSPDIFVFADPVIST